MKKLLSLILLSFVGVSAPLAEASDITSRLIRRNRLDLAIQDIQPYIFDGQVRARLDNWLHQESLSNWVIACQSGLRTFIRSEALLGPICYVLRNDDKEIRKQYLNFVKAYLFEMHAALKEIAEDPRYIPNDRARAEGLAKNYKSGEIDKFQACFEPAIKAPAYPADGSLPRDPFPGISSCLAERSRFAQVQAVNDRLGATKRPYFAVPLADAFAYHPGHAISPTGWIGGNQVTYLTKNDTSQRMVNAVAAKAQLVARHYPLNGAGKFEAFSTSDWSAYFTPAQGFYSSIDENPIWSQTGTPDRPSTYQQIKDAISSAQETIFIDVFFMGGTMGVDIAKHLLAKLDSTEGLKALILRDNYNHFGHAPQMRPVYNYLLAYSAKHPDKLVVAPSYIYKHRTGLPWFLNQVVTDEFLADTGVQDHISLYGRAISDHSKVMVIDGKTDHPTAFVGSKNWTDSSGAICYDEVAMITGPAAAVVQDDYYWDMAMAIKGAIASRQRDDHPEVFAKVILNGWAHDANERAGIKAADLRGDRLHEAVAHLLEPFDLLNRDQYGSPQEGIKVQVADVGESVLRTGMNNWDSSRTNAVDEDVQAILFAEQSIDISDQYLFDRNIVSALVRAKENHPHLKIRILLEPVPTAKPKGMPNLLYLDLLTQAGPESDKIEVRWKKTLEAEGVHQEYHMKTISVDGKYVISGSANKDQTTMYGSFREEQVDILDETAAAAHKAAFDSRWTDAQSTPFTGYQFDDFTPPGGLRPNEFVEVLRSIVSILFDAGRI